MDGGGWNLRGKDTYLKSDVSNLGGRGVMKLHNKLIYFAIIF
jgi:hypothetical protein